MFYSIKCVPVLALMQLERAKGLLNNRQSASLQVFMRRWGCCNTSIQPPHPQYLVLNCHGRYWKNSWGVQICHMQFLKNETFTLNMIKAGPNFWLIMQREYYGLTQEISIEKRLNSHLNIIRIQQGYTVQIKLL